MCQHTCRRRKHKKFCIRCRRRGCIFRQKDCIFFLLLFIIRSVALTLSPNSIQDVHRQIRSYNTGNVVVFLSRVDNYDSEPSFDDVERSKGDQDYPTKDTDNGREKDDLSDDEADADDYISKFTSDTLEAKTTTDDNSSEGDSSVLTETKRMIEQQQQQIDLLMNLVKQQNVQHQLSPSRGGGNMISSNKDQSRQSQPKVTNVAPLKANLFIDGTWLYYSLNTRNPDRCPIMKKFGKGWQNSYKVNW